MDTNYKNINPALLKQYTEVLSQEIQQNDKYNEFNNNFKRLGALNSISEAEKLFFDICNKNATDGSFMMNDCLITIEHKADTMRICMDSAKDYYSFLFFKD